MPVLSEIITHPDTTSETMRVKNETYQFALLVYFSNGRNSAMDKEDKVIDLSEQVLEEPLQFLGLVFSATEPENEVSRYFWDSERNLDDLFSITLASLGKLGWFMAGVTTPESINGWGFIIQRKLILTV
ncbi:MAG TPA: hypothetical protein PLD54_03685 [Candidatus Levybacteria bacterium]|nr:hypothetical protein [Candidatus Levybacteria bacterium]